jgi:hypothetical protein
LPCVLSVDPHRLVEATSVPCTESRAEQPSLQNMTESATADDSGATRAMELLFRGS